VQELYKKNFIFFCLTPVLCSGLACSVCKERSEFKNFEPLIKGFSSKFPNYFIIIFYFFSIFDQNHAFPLLF